MVIALFWLGVLALSLAALGLLLPPLLRRRSGDGVDRRDLEAELAVLRGRHAAGELDDAGFARERERIAAALLALLEAPAPEHPAPARGLAIGLAIAVPALAVAIWFAIGQPAALDPRALTAPAQLGNAQDMESALAGLEQRLRDEPTNIDGWLLLARSYRSLERFQDMLRATSSAFALAPAQPEVLVEHAEALALAGPDRRLGGQPRTLVEQALSIDPTQQKGLWLLGIAQQQDGDDAGAAATWTRLRALLPAGEPVVARLDEQIAAARRRAGLDAEATAAQLDDAGAAAEERPPQGPQIAVEVVLDAGVAAQAPPDATLFVIARAPGGGPPLAIRRIEAPRFPLVVSLSQADRMLDGVQIEMGASILVSARLSRSGQAQPAAGDLEAVPQAVVVGEVGALSLALDRAVEG
ncbi:MAG: c-type cytochrome biogenesis protein CcmI [Xanthomonadales bacterium]|nr:c-type cytochrome biogenesis protein CcmI [Xanthomonadales bacterium]